MITGRQSIGYGKPVNAIEDLSYLVWMAGIFLGIRSWGGGYKQMFGGVYTKRKFTLIDIKKQKQLY